MSFEHYPKYVENNDGESVIVNSEEEEKEICGSVTIIEEHEVYSEPANKQTQDEFEYPKWVDGVVVNNADEELELLGEAPVEENKDEEQIVLDDSLSALDSNSLIDEITPQGSDINSISNIIR